jgi:hypothetical protein
MATPYITEEEYDELMDLFDGDEKTKDSVLLELESISEQEVELTNYLDEFFESSEFEEINNYEENKAKIV